MNLKFNALFLLLTFLGIGFSLRAQDENIFTKDDFSVELPHLIVDGVEASGTLVCLDSDKLYLLGNEAQAIINGERTTLTFEKGEADFKMTFDRNEPMSIKVGGFTLVRDVTPMPLWLSIVPPLLVIVLALAFKEVVSSLIIGIITGAMIAAHYAIDSPGIIIGFLNAIDVYMVQAMADEGHVSVILFSTIIGGIVALISKNGGMQAVVDKISRRATSPKSGQMATWFLGIGIFFDDYANTLVVGNTMRPLSDRLHISREKLSYIVDSTAAPIAAIALITTWIGAELGYIQTALDQINAGQNMIESGPYIIFLGSLKYSFYPVFALVFMLILIQRNRDFGPMLNAEIHARSGVELSNTRQSQSSELDEFEPQKGAKLNMWNAIIPILVLVVGTAVGLVYTGYHEDPSVWASDEFALSRKLSIIIGNSDSYKGLLWSSMLGLMVAVLLSVVRKTLRFGDAISVSIDGFKTMVPAMVILILAWSLAALTDQMHTADYLTSLVEGRFAVWALPAITFLLSAIVAFSTGSSWGTMAIIYPIMLPLAWSLSIESGYEPAAAMEIFLNTTSTVLAGAVLGDHCSPISDTTILSSLATRCDHIQHVKTQLPYALTVGAVAILFTSLSALLPIPWLLNYLIGIVLLYFVVSLFGKKVTVD